MLSQQAKTNFRQQRWKSVLSICGNKCPACPVARLGITRRLKSTVQNEQLMERHTPQAMSLFPQRPETAVPGAAGNRCFRLLGGIPNPLNRPLRWSGCAAILPLRGYRPLLIFRSRLRSGNCGFSIGTEAAPSKFSSSVRPACFRNS